MGSTSAPIVLITGANQGIGYSIAEIFSESKNPYTILVGARNPTRGQEAVDKLKSHKTNPQSTLTNFKVDINSSESIAAAVDKISKDYGRLDILINNAGVGGGEGGSTTRRVDWQAVFEVNVFGTMELTEACFSLLKKSSDPKVVLMSSSMGSITMSESYGAHPLGTTVSAYRASKAAINMMLVEYSNNIKGIRFWGVDPGLCATDFAGDFSKNNGRNPREGADIARQCIEGEREDCVGKVVWEENGTGVRPW